MPRVKEVEATTHRTMQVVNHIRGLIENGTLQPGDKIPPERELARSLKISRATASAPSWPMALRSSAKDR